MSIFFRLMLFVPILRSFMLLDEEEGGNTIKVSDEDTARRAEQPSEAELLSEIEHTATALAAFIAQGMHPRLEFHEHYRVFARNRPRRWWLRKCFGHYEMPMVRLKRLHHPLWLGKDGVIYRAYGEFYGSYLWDYPDYHMKAEIWKRNTDGLTYILHRLELMLSECEGLEG